MRDTAGADFFPDLPGRPANPRRGVLPDVQIEALVARGAVSADRPISDAQIQPASLDLRLGERAYEVVASFLPGRTRTVLESLAPLQIAEIDLREGAVLQRGSVYIIPLLERLDLTAARTLAKANPKSTTGRLDVFARLISDYSEVFDRVARGYAGPLYIEVAPRTFAVEVRTGTRLNQLRFVRGASSLDATRKATNSNGLLYDKFGEPSKPSVLAGVWFSVDLEGDESSQIIGWKARNDAPVLDFDCIGCYEPLQFWHPICRSDVRQHLIMEPGAFYILGSKEQVVVPRDYAAEMVPYDPAIGEFRVHYAGFFDPGFGITPGESRGTRAILEVRPHEVPYALTHGQKMGRLVYEQLTAAPQRLYGEAIGSSYQRQGLGLGKQFRDPSPAIAATRRS